MNRLVRATSLAALLALAGPGAAKDEAPPADVPGGAPVTGAPRVAALADGRLLVASPVAGGVEVVTMDAAAASGRTVGAVRRDGLMVGGRRGPRIAVQGGVVVLAAVTQRTKEGGGDLLAWRSADGGATWGEAVRVNDVLGAAAEGLFDLAALGDGRVLAVWLDGRAKGTRLRADFSSDAAKWGEDVLAYELPDGTICECCHPAAAAAEGGGAVVAFRNALKGERDIWTTRLPRGAAKFEPAKKSGRGSWRLAACPMAGPAVGVVGDETVCAWRREGDVFLATGAAKERGLGEGDEPQLFVGEGGVHVLWTVKDALFHLAPGAAAPTKLAQGVSYPCAAAGVVVWEDAPARRARIVRIP